MNRLAPIIAILPVLLACGGPKVSPEPPPPAPTDLPALQPYEVELTEGTDPARLAELTQLGARIPENPHIEGDRYLIRLPVDRADAVRELELVAGLEPRSSRVVYVPSRFEVEEGDVEIVVDLFRDVGVEGREEVIDRVGELGGEVLATPPDTVRARIPVGAVAQLAELPEVRWIEPR